VDLAISKHTGTVSYHPHLGISDHIAIFVSFQMDLHVPSSLPSKKVYHWKSAPWTHIHGYFRRVKWDFLKTESVSDAIDKFLMMVRDHYVSSLQPRLNVPLYGGTVTVSILITRN